MSSRDRIKPSISLRFCAGSLSSLLLFLSLGVAAHANFGFEEARPLISPSQSDLDGRGESPDIATNGKGLWIAVWSSDAIRYSRSVDNGAAWSAPGTICGSASCAGDGGLNGIAGPRIATGANGTWIVTWLRTGTSPEQTGTFFSRSTDGGSTWEAPRPLGTAPGIQLAGLNVATDGKGRWMAAWSYDAFLPSGGISVSSDDGVTWECIPSAMGESPCGYITPARAATPPKFPGFLTLVDALPTITTDGAGLWTLAWNHFEGIFGDTAQYDILSSEIQISQSGDFGATWSAPRAVSGPFTGAFPQVRADASGGIAVAWRSLPGEFIPFRDYRLDVGDLLATVSKDHGASWSPPIVVAPSRTGELFYVPPGIGPPGLASDGEGNWLVAGQVSVPLYSGYRPENMDFVVARSQSGGRSWQGPAVLSGNAPPQCAPDILGFEYIERGPRLASGGGACIAIWNNCQNWIRDTEEEQDVFISRSLRLDAPGNGADAGAITIPAPVFGGATFEATIAFRNIGLNPWTSEGGFKIALEEDACSMLTLPYPRFDVSPGQIIRPGETFRAKFPLSAPHAAADCSLRFRMIQEFVELFGEPLKVLLTISRPNAAASWALYD